MVCRFWGYRFCQSLIVGIAALLYGGRIVYNPVLDLGSVGIVFTARDIVDGKLSHDFPGDASPGPVSSLREGDFPVVGIVWVSI